MLRVHGARKKYFNEIVGYSSRLDTLQAAILRVKLPYVDEWNMARRSIATRYDAGLQGLPDLITPTELVAGTHVYHQYTVRILNRRRDAVQAALAKHDIGSMIYYPFPLNQLPVYAHMSISMPQAEAAAHEVLSLPMWPYFSEEQQTRVINTLTEILSNDPAVF
ncbi:MAG: DegT/DnrJ/EryC1/StrS family aminotransferase, partial [Anaerolineae bacterium]|nr:DegT/DnrJ/EryC1/StrS family aminotransferase [Anaerolineae bacterium]